MERKIKQLKRLKVLYYQFVGLCALKKIEDFKGKKKRSCSVRKCNRDRKRNGFFAVSFCKVKEMDHEQFFIYTRMTPQIYELLLNILKPHLQKKSIREPVQPECRLAVTLLYLTQGTSFLSLACSFKLGKETVRCIILETTEVLRSQLINSYVSEPNADNCKQITQDFWDSCDIPNCMGPIDGKHISIKFPNNSNQPQNNNKFSSIVLLAACDTRYRFTYVDVGTYGNQNDGGIFQASKFGQQIINNELSIPSPKNLPSSQIKLPHFFIGNTSLPLTKNIMRPYSGELSNEKIIFNKSLLRVHRTIENAFGVLMARWRVLLTTLHLFPENAEKIVLSCVALHNFIMLNDIKASNYIPHNYVDWEDSNCDLQNGLWRSEIGNDIPSSIKPSPNVHRYGGKSSTEIRNNLCNFIASRQQSVIKENNL